MAGRLVPLLRACMGHSLIWSCGKPCGKRVNEFLSQSYFKYHFLKSSWHTVNWNSIHNSSRQNQIRFSGHHLCVTTSFMTSHNLWQCTSLHSRNVSHHCLGEVLHKLLQRGALEYFKDRVLDFLLVVHVVALMTTELVFCHHLKTGQKLVTRL